MTMVRLPENYARVVTVALCPWTVLLRCGEAHRNTVFRIAFPEISLWCDETLKSGWHFGWHTLRRTFVMRDGEERLSHTTVAPGLTFADEIDCLLFRLMYPLMVNDIQNCKNSESDLRIVQGYRAGIKPVL